MNKIVYNDCYGGYSLSNKAGKWLVKNLDKIIYAKEIKSIKRQLKNKDDFISPQLIRHNSILVKCIEELGKEANGECADLQIYETESDLYTIDEYDGMETVIVPDTIKWIIIK